MTTTCPTSGIVEGAPYNAKGRPMLLAVCPSCGREYRVQGRSAVTVIPEHEAAR